MERWAGAFQEIRVRNFRDLLGHAPQNLAFAFEGDTCTLKEFVCDAWSADQPANLVLNFQERGSEYVRGFLAGYSKFEHVLDCSRNMFARGSLTWGLVDAYHASLVGARSITAALGVCVFSIGGRTALVDLFPEQGSKDHKKAFTKHYKGIEFPIRVLAPSKDKVLEQSKMWGLIERLFNLKSFATSGEQIVQLGLLELLASKPWADRHEILYDLVSWRWPTDIGATPIPHAELESMLFSTDQELIEFNSFVDRVYELNRLYASDFIEKTAGKSLKLPAGAGTVTLPGVVA